MLEDGRPLSILVYRENHYNIMKNSDFHFRGWQAIVHTGLPRKHLAEINRCFHR